MGIKEKIDQAFDYATANGFEISSIALKFEAYAAFQADLLKDLPEGTSAEISRYRGAGVSRGNLENDVCIDLGYNHEAPKEA